MRHRATYVRPLRQRVAIVATMAAAAVTSSAALTYVIVAASAR